MVLLFVAVCWCRANRYKPSKWTLFRILHQNRVQNIIQCHDNKIWKQMCIKKCVIVLRPIFNTTYKGSLCTREWDRKGHLGLDHVLKHLIRKQVIWNQILWNRSIWNQMIRKQIIWYRLIWNKLVRNQLYTKTAYT